MPPTYTEAYVNQIEASLASTRHDLTETRAELETLREAFHRSGPQPVTHQSPEHEEELAESWRRLAHERARVAELTRERDQAVMMAGVWRRACNQACLDLDEARAAIAEHEQAWEDLLDDDEGDCGCVTGGCECNGTSTHRDEADVDPIDRFLHEVRDEVIAGLRDKGVQAAGVLYEAYTTLRKAA